MVPGLLKDFVDFSDGVTMLQPTGDPSSMFRKKFSCNTCPTLAQIIPGISN